MSEGDKFESVKTVIDQEVGADFVRYVFEFVLGIGKNINPDLWKLFVRFARKN